MTTNRSTEELAMRDAVAAWGRKRWPSARMVHELVVSDRRVDMAFIGREHLVGVEIKGPKDTLDRLDDQIATFCDHLPEVWLAVHPRWTRTVEVLRGSKNHVYLDDDGRGRVRNWIAVDPDDAEPVKHHYMGQPTIDRTVTAPMLHLLWRDEAVAIAARMRVAIAKREPLRNIVPELARKLTGDEIVREVCRELRARAAFPAHPPSDAPIAGEAAR